MSISDRLKQVRASLSLSQDEMTEKIGMGKGGWKQLEKLGRLPGTDFLIKISEIGFSIDWIISGTGEMRTFSSSLAQTEKATNGLTDLDLALIQIIINMLTDFLKQKRKPLSSNDFGKVVVAIFKIVKRKTARDQRTPAEATVHETIHDYADLLG